MPVAASFIFFSPLAFMILLSSLETTIRLKGKISLESLVADNFSFKTTFFVFKITETSAFENRTENAKKQNITDKNATNQSLYLYLFLEYFTSVSARCSISLDFILG